MTVYDNGSLDLLLKNTFSLLNTFGFKIVNSNIDLNNFKLELESNLENKEVHTIDSNLLPLLLTTLNLVNKILCPSLSEDTVTYNFINLVPQCSEMKLFVEVDIIRTKKGVFFLEAYCYDWQNILISKASSFMYLS